MIKKLEKYPVRRLAVGRVDGRDKEWQHELDVLEKRWQKLKKSETEKAKKREKKQNGDDGWVQVGADD